MFSISCALLLIHVTDSFGKRSYGALSFCTQRKRSEESLTKRTEREIPRRPIGLAQNDNHVILNGTK